jgi:hypothetical protein
MSTATNQDRWPPAQSLPPGGYSKTRCLFVEAIVRHRPRFTILAKYRGLKTDAAPIIPMYDRLNELVLES